MLAELAALGFEVRSPAELPKLRVRYDRALPALTKWLSLVSHCGVKEEIVRALSVPFATQAAPLLIEEFRRAGSNCASLKWAIGNALEVVAGDAVFDDLAAIVQDRSHGKAREMAVAALGNMSDARAADVLVELLDDDEVAGHAIFGLRKLKAATARGPLLRFLDHPKAWVRKEAKKAITAIDRSSVHNRRRQ